MYRMEKITTGIPCDQFVSVRVEMPADSLYNQRIRDVVQAMTAGDSE
ncbi:hypothetical protein ABFP30_002607 [Enterobacter bugandensis]